MLTRMFVMKIAGIRLTSIMAGESPFRTDQI